MYTNDQLDQMTYEELYEIFENEVLTTEEKSKVLFYLSRAEGEISEIWRRVYE